MEIATSESCGTTPIFATERGGKSFSETFSDLNRKCCLTFLTSHPSGTSGSHGMLEDFEMLPVLPMLPVFNLFAVTLAQADWELELTIGNIFTLATFILPVTASAIIDCFSSFRSDASFCFAATSRSTFPHFSSRKATIARWVGSGGNGIENPSSFLLLKHGTGPALSNQFMSICVNK